MKIQTPPLPLPYMGGERLRMVLKSYNNHPAVKEAVKAAVKEVVKDV